MIVSLFSFRGTKNSVYLHLKVISFDFNKQIIYVLSLILINLKSIETELLFNSVVASQKNKFLNVFICKEGLWILESMWLEATNRTFMNFSFLFCENGVVITPTIESFCEDWIFRKANNFLKFSNFLDWSIVNCSITFVSGV